MNRKLTTLATLFAAGAVVALVKSSLRLATTAAGELAGSQAAVQ